MIRVFLGMKWNCRYKFRSMIQYAVSCAGRASHAAAAPWLGVNALDAAVACYTSMSMLRQQTKPTSRVHAVITDGGAKPNIIPERSQLNIYMRGLTDEDTLDLAEKVRNCAKGAAAATGEYSYLMKVISQDFD